MIVMSVVFKMYTILGLSCYLFNHRNFFYILVKFSVKVHDLIATAGQFLHILFIIRRALSASVFYLVSGGFLGFQIFEVKEYNEAFWHGIWCN